MGIKQILVDTNIIIDIINANTVWADISKRALRDMAHYSTFLINPIIYAELAFGFVEIEALDDFLFALSIQKVDLPCKSSSLAAQAFRTYRNTGGKKTSTLPDFFIGAHAAAMEYTILTRDPKLYRRYFQTVAIHVPE